MKLFRIFRILVMSKLKEIPSKAEKSFDSMSQKKKW